MSNELESLILEFDQGFTQAIIDDDLYQEYNRLQQQINADEKLTDLITRQKILQQEVMNLTFLRQNQFTEIKKKELDQVDLAIDLHEDLNDLKQIIYQLEIEQDFIKKKIRKWKEANGFKK